MPNIKAPSIKEPSFLAQALSNHSLSLWDSFGYAFNKVLVIGIVDEQLFTHYAAKRRSERPHSATSLHRSSQHPNSNINASQNTNFPQATKQFSEAGEEGGLLFLADAQALVEANLPTASYDLCIVNLTLNQETPAEILLQLWHCYRILKPNSLAIINFFGTSSLDAFKKNLVAAELTLGNKAFMPIKNFTSTSDMVEKVRHTQFKNLAVISETFRHCYQTLDDLFRDLEGAACLHSNYAATLPNMALLEEAIRNVAATATTAAEAAAPINDDNPIVNTQGGAHPLDVEWELVTIIGTK